MVMQTHLQQGLSVAYYSGDNKLLGGAEWPLPAIVGATKLCLSGLEPDGVYRTSCTNAVADNSLPGPSSVSFCSVNFAQPNLQDGCYPPPPTAGAISPNGTTPMVASQTMTSAPTGGTSRAGTDNGARSRGPGSIYAALSMFLPFLVYEPSLKGQPGVTIGYAS